MLMEVSRMPAAKPSWVAVKDRMPLDGTKCLAYIPASDLGRDIMVVATWTPDQGWWPGGPRRAGVTHWMPLPGRPE